MGFGYVDIVLFCDSWRAVPHQFGQGMPVHSALGASGTERVTPAVKRETFQAGLPDCSEMRFLDADEVPGITWSRKDPALPPGLHL